MGDTNVKAWFVKAPRDTITPLTAASKVIVVSTVAVLFSARVLMSIEKAPPVAVPELLSTPPT